MCTHDLILPAFAPVPDLKGIEKMLRWVRMMVVDSVHCVVENVTRGPILWEYFLLLQCLFILCSIEEFGKVRKPFQQRCFTVFFFSHSQRGWLSGEGKKTGK